MSIILQNTLSGSGACNTRSGSVYTGSIDLSSLTLSSGDVLVINLVAGGVTASVTFSGSGNNGGTGNTTVTANTYSNDTNDTNQGVLLVVQGSTVDTSVTVTSSVPLNSFAWTLFQYSGVDTSVVTDVTTTTAIGGNTDASSPPAITPNSSGAKIVVCYAGSQNSPAAWTTPSDVSNFIQTDDGASSRVSNAAMGDKSWTSGAFTPAALLGGDRSTSDSWSGVTVALRSLGSSPLSTTKYKVITSGTSFATPSDWNNSNNKVHCIGAGSSGTVSNTTAYGGGGGAYAVTTNLTLSGTVSCQIGAVGGTTTVPSGTAHTWVKTNATVRAAGAGASATGGTTANSVGTTTFAGGNGNSSTRTSGGGAAGPTGAGGSASTSAGGAGDAGSANGGTGGTWNSAGAISAGGNGTTWTDSSTSAVAGAGGGGGGSNSGTATAGGLYGAGGGGVAGTTGTAGAGTAGVIVLEWLAIINPTITNRTTRTIMPYSNYTILLTADQDCTWSITGGANSSDFTLSGSTLTLSNKAAPNSSKVVQVTATNSLGGATAATLTLNTLLHARRVIRGF